MSAVYDELQQIYSKIKDLLYDAEKNNCSDFTIKQIKWLKEDTGELLQRYNNFDLQNKLELYHEESILNLCRENLEKAKAEYDFIF